MHEDELKPAKDAIREMFLALKIERVICVDDDYVDADVADLIGLCEGAEIVTVAQVAALTIFDFSKPPDLWKEQIRGWWRAATSPERSALYTHAKVALQIGPTGIDYSGKLKELLHDLCEYLEIKPSDWRIRNSALLTEANSKRTLFLFDKDLRNDGGTEEEGLSFLKNAILNEEAICGILSNTFDIDHEVELWQQYAQQQGIADDRFVLISKSNLDSEAFQLPRMLKLLILNKPCKEISKLVSEAWKVGHEAAEVEIAGIGIFDYEDIVFKKSRTEGIWEPETLHRIFELYHRRKFRQTLKSNTKLPPLIAKVRSVLEVQTHDSYSSIGASWKIQRLEWLEEGGDLNPHFVPIGLGDLFQQSSGKKKIFALLAQPCDLMVRSNGKRAYDLAEVYLLELSSKGSKASSFEVWHYDETSGKSYFVNFGSRRAVSLDVLDLCAFSETGEARYQHSSQPNPLIIPSLAERFQRLSKLYGPTFDKLNNVPESERQETAKNLFPKDSRDVLFPITTNAGPPASITYGCKRIGRICEPFATKALTSFCSYLSRPADPLDLAREMREA